MKRAGIVLTVGAAVGMGIYFTAVGLDKANEVAGVLGAFIGLVGLALAFYGIASGRASGAPPSAGQLTDGKAGVETRARAAGNAVINIVADSTIHGTVIQSGNIAPTGSNNGPEE